MQRSRAMDLTETISTTSMFDNTTIPDTITGTILEHPVEAKVALVISWIEFVLITCLNSFLIVILLKRKRKSRMSFFVLNMAISDLTVALFYLLPDIIMRTTQRWLSGAGDKIVCVLYQYLSHVAAYASSYMLVVLSIDRLYVLARPLQSSRRGQYYKYSMIGTAWAVALVLAIPQPIEGATLIPFGEYYLCDVHYSSPILEKVFITLFFCAVLIIPTIIITVCYVWIVWIIWGRKISGMPGQCKTTYQNIDSRGSTANGDSNIITRARVRSIQMTFVVVIVYVVCWSPLCFNVLMLVYGVIKPGASYFILMALAPLNSAANPIVFILFNYNILITPGDREKLNAPLTATMTTSLLHSSSGTSMKMEEKQSRYVMNDVPASDKMKD